VFRGNGLARDELPTGHMRPFDPLKFSRDDAGTKIAANLGIRDVAHIPPKSIANQCLLLDNCLSLKKFVSRKGYRFKKLVIDQLCCFKIASVFGGHQIGIG
jgi:hypothetical protein